MTDKLIMVFAMLIFVGVVFAIIYQQVAGDSDKPVVVVADGTAAKPPPI